MASESGGPFAKRKDTCLQFDRKPLSVVYLPSLSCLIATSCNGTLQVLDIHSGCNLRTIHFEPEEYNETKFIGLLCGTIEDSEQLLLCKENIIGCRGILGEKILLDSFLQYDCKEKNTWKIELDLVQAGILLNSLQSCQRMSSSPQFGTPVKSEEDVKTVTDELQKQYEKVLTGVKDFTKKSVKWMTVCLEMEKQLLSDVFVWLYAIMSRQVQDPSLPIIGDVVRRISLCNPPEKKNDFGRIERILMLGEAERLRTFETWPHKEYEYALPGPMAEAGFYHPAYSTASEDRAICFKCDICLVYWEPSDQPWSEHERHSSSCPFVKGEFTGNVPLSVCAAVCQAESLKHKEEKIICIGKQSCDNLAVVGSNRGTVYLLDTFPVLKVTSKLKKFSSSILVQPSSVSNVENVKDTEDTKYSSSSSSINNEGDEMEESGYTVDIVIEPQGTDAHSLSAQLEAVNVQHLLDLDNATVCDNNLVGNIANGGIVTRVSHSRSSKRGFNVEIQALTICKHRSFGNNKGPVSSIVIGRKCSFASRTGEPHLGREVLSIAVVDTSIMKKIDRKKADEKSKSAAANAGPPFVGVEEDAMLYKKFKPYMTGDPGELSVINEYLRARKQKEKASKDSKSKKKESSRKEILCQEVKLPSNIDARSHVISHLFATKCSLFVVVKYKENIDEDDVRSEEQDEEYSSVDSDTEIIEMPRSHGRVTSHPKPVRKSESFLLEYRWVQLGDRIVLHETHISSRPFPGEEYLHDVILISNKNLGFKEQRYDKVSEKVRADSSDIDLLLAATGVEQKQIIVISTVDLQTLSVIPLETASPRSMIRCIVYCKGISVVACCFDDGTVMLCHLEDQSRKLMDEPKNEPMPQAAQSLEGPITEEKLSQLLNLTKFEAINTGVHVFLPMDWVVGTASLSANAPLQSKRRLYPHVRDIYPITSPSLPKGRNNVASSSLNDKRLRSKGQTVSFKVFVSSETAVGYIDLSIECCSSISKDSDVVVSLYLIHSNHFLDDGEDSQQRELICGPILFSEYCSTSTKKASLMLTSSKLAAVKSSYLAIDLEYRSKQGSNVENEAASATGSNGESSGSVMAIADFMRNVQIVVYQYSPVMSDAHIPVSCRFYLLEDMEIKRRLLKQFLDASWKRKCIGEDSEASKCLEVITWIWNMLTYSKDSVRENFVALVEENLSDLIRVSFINGDRTLSHRFYQLTVSILRYSKKRGYTNFSTLLLSALNKLMGSLRHFFSVGSLRWFFRLCNVAVTDCSAFDAEMLLSSMLGPLLEVVKMHREAISDKQMLLQTRFDLVGSTLEPIMAEPTSIELVIGDNSTQKAEVPDYRASQSTKEQKKSVSIPASDVPGILEVDQLGFTCLMTSEGSRCEKLTKSNDIETSSYKVGVKPNENYEEPTSSQQAMPLVPLDYEEDIPFLDPQSLYEDMEDLESEFTIGYDELDCNVYEVLEGDSFDVWTPSTNQGWIDRRARVVKRRGRTVKQNIPYDIDNEFITPETMLLVVERMHAAAQHFAVIDFQRPVVLTDVLIPPCESLSSLSVYAWKEHQTENEAVHVVTYNEISEKILVLTDIIPSIKCRYLKIVATGCRKLRSTKISLALGNFYGRPANGTYQLSQLKSRVQQQYDRVYCRYALACDRLITEIEDMMNYGDGVIHRGASETQGRLVTSYKECAKAQLSLNHVYRSLKFYELQSNAFADSQSRSDNAPLSLDFMRVLAECLIDTVLLTLRSYSLGSGNPERFGMPIVNLGLDHCLELFQTFCCLGSAAIRYRGSMLLQCICERQPWWREFTISLLKYCFEEKAIHGVPKERLFGIFVTMLRTTGDLNSLLLSLVEILQDVLSPLSDRRSRDTKLDFEMADWLLLLLNELFQNLDQGDWLFLSPRKALAKEASSLEKRAEEQIKVYLHDQQKELKRFHKNLHYLATTAKKKYPNTVVMVPDGSSSSKELKDLLLLRRHPLFNKKRKDKPVKMPSSLLEGEDYCYDKARAGYIDKLHVLPCVKALLKLMLISISEDGFERFILACKVATQMFGVSNAPIYLSEVAQLEDLVDLLRLPLLTTAEQAQWINHAVVCFLQQSLRKGKPASSIPEAGVPYVGIKIPLNLEANVERSPSSGSSGNSSETLSSQEGEPVEEKLTCIASSIATSLMKSIKETVGDRSDLLVEADKQTKLQLSKAGRKQGVCHLMDGFDRNFQIESNQMCFGSYRQIDEVMRKGLWKSNTAGEEVYGERTFDKEKSLEDDSLVSYAFAKLVKIFANSENLSVVIHQWLALNSAPKDVTNQSQLQLPVAVAQTLMASNEYNAGNKYISFLYEKVLLGLLHHRIGSVEVDPLPVFRKGLEQRSYCVQSSRSISLLKAFGECFSISKEPVKTDDKKDDARSFVSLPDSESRLFIKGLILEVLKNGRTSDKSWLDVLAIANGMPIFETLEEDEVEMTFEILKLLVNSFRTYVEDNKGVIMSLGMECMSCFRPWLVYRGRSWQLGKFCIDESETHLDNYLLFLNRLFCSLLANSVSGSRLLELLYGKDSNIIQDLLDVLFVACDSCNFASVQHDFPASIVPHAELVARESKLHPVIQGTYQILMKLANVAFDRHRILGAIVSYLEVKKNALYAIPRTMAQLLRTLLPSKADVDLFVERGGLLMICDRISRNAESLEWSYGRKAGRSTVQTVLRRELIGSKPIEETEDWDESLLENFAPCSRMICPPNCPSADVLLQSYAVRKSTSRFPAWSYRYNDINHDWLVLTVEFPFAILLRIIEIFHHSPGGCCPSEVSIEVKGCGDIFVPQSPDLLTNSIPKLEIYIANGVIAKDLRIKLKRSLDIDEIRLDRIRLFGRSMLTPPSKQLLSEFDRRYYWIDLLNHVENTAGVLDRLGKLTGNAESLISALLVFLNLSSSGRSSYSEVVFDLLVKIFKKNASDWFRILTTCILRNDGKSKVNACRPAVETEVGRALLAAVTPSLDAESISRCLLILLQWIKVNLQKELSYDVKVFGHQQTRFFDCIAGIFNKLSGAEDIDQALVREVTELLSSRILKVRMKDTDVDVYSRLLASLAIFDSHSLDALIKRCLCLLDKNGLHVIGDEEKLLLHVLSTVCQNKVTVQLVIDSQLPSKVLYYIEQIVTDLSSVNPDNLLPHLSSLYTLVGYIYSALSYFEFKEWIGSTINFAVFQALLEFLSAAYLDKCLVATPCHNRDSALGLTHKLQHITIALIKRVMSCSHRNKALFVTVMKKLLEKEASSELSLLSNSFLKRLMVQLILEEETIAIEFRRWNGTECDSTNMELNVPHVDFKIVSRKRMRLSDRLSSIFCVGESALSCPNRKRGLPVSDSKAQPSYQYQEIPENTELNSNMEVMIASAQSASAKRRAQAVDEFVKKCKKRPRRVVYDVEYYHSNISKDPLPHELTIGQVLYILEGNRLSCNDGHLTLHVRVKPRNEKPVNSLKQISMLQSDTYPTLLRVFAADGGVQLLAKHSRMSLSGQFGQTISNSIGFLMRFVSLTGFSDIFLKENQKAEYLLRLMLGEEESSSGEPIALSSLAADLPLLPFLALRDLFKSAPLQSECGQSLRKDALEKDIIKLLLNHLGSLCSQETTKIEHGRKIRKSERSEVRPSYWARGTGFGTGSTASTWNVDKVMLEKKKEDEQVICLLQILSSYIDPLDKKGNDLLDNDQCHLPEGILLCLEESPLRSVLANYLRNDSVLDMARHIPLFNALMENLRALASNGITVPLLLPKGVNPTASTALAGQSGSADQLLSKLKDCADTYMNRLKVSRKKKPVSSKKSAHVSKPIEQIQNQAKQSADGSSELASEALTLLIKNIQETSTVVQMRIRSYEQKMKEERDHDMNMDCNGAEETVERSLEDIYMEEMKMHQFGSFEFVAEEGDDGKVEFLVPFYFAEKLRTAVASGDFSFSTRARRLAQEIASLSTSLPLSFSSSVFLRCDENRLDLMKVLITGPEDTPYANGCFEFDIYFPRDYPNSPMMVNLQTNGQHSVRFNPNLYNDGKVCLSILNTWHGRPEEKWNPQTSNLLQVLVSIQSLILVPEPYFNEPGYERSRGTPIGQQNSMDYNANIKQATIKWAMLEQLRNPAPCFKQIIRKHFFLKKAAIVRQCELWISQVKDHSTKKKSIVVHYEAMKRHFAALKTELDKLSNDQHTSDCPSPPSQHQEPQSNADSTAMEDGNVVYL